MTTKQKKPHTPPPLPIKIDYLQLLPVVTKAHTALGRLDATLDQLPNPRLLERSFMTHEAVESSKIEGTQASLRDVFEFEADFKQELSERKRGDIEEVLNYRTALEYGVKKIDAGFPITENLIKELHKILLTSARGAAHAPGEFRAGQVFIGSHGASIESASYIPPEAHQIVALISNLEKYLNHNAEQDSLVQIAVAHYQFEAIHPFWDGNGRVGRLIISLFLYKQGLLKKPWLYLSEYFERNRQEYYALLRGVSENENWSAWIEFFLRGVEQQSVHACERVSLIRALYEKTKAEALDVGSTYAVHFVEAIFMKPIFSRRGIQKISHVKNYQTLSNLVDVFLKNGIIQELDPKQKRNKIYVFVALMKLIK